jgi:hypothetical protein
MVRIRKEDIKFPSSIIVGSFLYNVEIVPEEDGAMFDAGQFLLRIGTKSLDSDPNYVWMVINHEIMEMVFANMGVRYADPSVRENWKFFMDHKEFENCIIEFSKVIVQFLNLK